MRRHFRQVVGIWVVYWLDWEFFPHWCRKGSWIIQHSIRSSYSWRKTATPYVSCYPLVLFGLSLSTCSVNSGCQNRVATQIHKRIVRARSGRHPECWLIMRLVCAKGKKVHTFSNWWYVTREITLTFASKTRQARYKISAEGFVKRQNGSNLKSSATTWSSQDSKAVSEIGAWVTGECDQDPGIAQRFGNMRSCTYYCSLHCAVLVL